MSQAAIVLLVVGVLLSAVQVTWSRIATRIDLLLMPVSSRRHVQRVIANATHIHLTALALGACAVFVQLVALVD